MCVVGEQFCRSCTNQAMSVAPLNSAEHDSSRSLVAGRQKKSPNELEGLIAEECEMPRRDQRGRRTGSVGQRLLACSGLIWGLQGVGVCLPGRRNCLL